MQRWTLLPIALAATLLGCTQPRPAEVGLPEAPAVGGDLPRRLPPEPTEGHFGELLMLTDGGENAEAYFSFDGNQLIFQSTRPPFQCDQIFTIGVDGSGLRQVSDGSGRTTCAYFYPDGEHVLYASTHLAGRDCPPPPDFSHGYTWALYAGYDIFRARVDGGDAEPLAAAPGYDAEATISPAGDRVVFTSLRNGDLDLYSMRLDGSDLKRLTHDIGYDGGAFFSRDGKRIVYRAHHPTVAAEIEDYRSLLGQGLIRPGKLEIWVMDADGSSQRQVTSLGAASFAPFFHPSGERVIFSSNHGQPGGREFELFLVNLDGSGLEQVTHSPEFDGFPMWAPDGKRFVFCSNRHHHKEGETNVFVTTWRD